MVDIFNSSKPFFLFIVSLSKKLSEDKNKDFYSLFNEEISEDIRVIKSFSVALESYGMENFDYVKFFKKSLRLNTELAEVLTYCFKCLINSEVVDIDYIKERLKIKEDEY